MSCTNFFQLHYSLLLLRLLPQRCFKCRAKRRHAHAKRTAHGHWKLVSWWLGDRQHSEGCRRAEFRIRGIYCPCGTRKLVASYIKFEWPGITFLDLATALAYRRYRGVQGATALIKAIGITAPRFERTQLVLSKLTLGTISLFGYLRMCS